MTAFVEQLGPLGIPLGELLAMMCAESGLDPAASSGVAWGIHQAQGPLMRAAGWTAPPAAFGRLTVLEQMPWVAKMLRVQIGGIGYTPRTGGELYRMNLSPKAARARRHVIYSRAEPLETKFYLRNKALDRGGKGWIDLDDLTAQLERAKKTRLYGYHAALLARLTPRA